MISITITERKKIGKEMKEYTRIHFFKANEKALEIIKPVVQEMNIAKINKTIPKLRIDGVSYETDSEKLFLVETGALK